MVAHGSRPVTGASDPNARATPWDANSANGLRRSARSIPRRRAYMPSGPPQSASKLGCMLAITPHAPSLAACSAVTISRCSRRWPQRATAGTPRSSTTRSKAATTAGDRGVADDVESGCHIGFGARPHVCLDGLGVQIAGAGVVGIGVRLVQPGGARSQRAVDEQVAGQPGAHRSRSISARGLRRRWSPPHPSNRSPRRRWRGRSAHVAHASRRARRSAVRRIRAPRRSHPRPRRAARPARASSSWSPVSRPRAAARTR